MREEEDLRREIELNSSFSMIRIDEKASDEHGEVSDEEKEEDLDDERAASNDRNFVDHGGRDRSLYVLQSLLALF